MKSSRFFKLLLNVYPPYIGAGISVKKVSPDFKEIVVQMKLRWYNRNYFNTHFGGSLYAMVDPFYVLMLVQILGKDYIVWDRAAGIEFLKPGRGTVTTVFKISDAQIREITEKTAAGQKFLPELPAEVLDETGATVARVTKTLYIKRKGTV